MYRSVLGILVFLFCIFFLTRCQCASSSGFGISFKKANAEEEAFYDAVTVGKSIETIESFLKDGHDPNYMNARRAIPWYDTNPLWRVCNNYEKAELFIKYNADVKNRPYLYKILFATPILSEKYPDTKLLENIRTRNENEVYDLVKLFLDAGSDSNLKGASGLAPFAFNRDRAYKKYFEEKGELPINSAILDSAFTIVDLLIRYGAKIDETSLDAAQEATARIGNNEMEKYIQEIWENQNDVSK